MSDNDRGTAVQDASHHREVMKSIALRWFDEHKGQPMAMRELFDEVNTQISDTLHSQALLPREELVRSLLNLMDQRILKWDSSLRLVPVSDEVERG